MKKLLVLLMSLLLCMALVGCTTTTDTTTTDTTDTTETTDTTDTTDTTETVGGWTIYEDETVPQITDEANAALEKALEGYTGAGFAPIAEIATQVVSGTNYMILCRETLVTAEPVTGLAMVTVYQDLEGNCEITNVVNLDLGELSEAKSAVEDTTGMVGAWTLNENLTTVNLPADAANAFTDVTDGLVGASYEPLALLGTQVVSGTNYAILAKQTMVTETETECVGIMFIYVDASGTATFTSFYVLNPSEFNQ